MERRPPVPGQLGHASAPHGAVVSHSLGRIFLPVRQGPWWTKLGGARESILENGQGTTFPLRICERAWWLKVDLIPKPSPARRGGKATKGPALMEVDEVKGPPSNPEEEIRETQTPEHEALRVRSHHTRSTETTETTVKRKTMQ